MSRVPLIVAAAAIAGLGTYALWPEPAAAATVRALPAGTTAAAWTATLGDRRITVDGSSVTVGIGVATTRYDLSTEGGGAVARLRRGRGSRHQGHRGCVRRAPARLWPGPGCRRRTGQR